MIKPIIVMPERHWDVLAKETLLASIPMLNRYGYDTYCGEMPSDYDQQDYLDTSNSTINHIESFLESAKPYLDKNQTTVEELANMKFEKLNTFLRNYVSSKKHSELAVHIKELPGHKMTRKVLDKMISLQGKLQGVDLEREKLDRYFSPDVQFDIKAKSENIKLTESQRIKSFLSRVIALQKEGKGVIFVVGKSHYENIVLGLKAEEHLGEVLFFYPHSHQTFSEKIDDRDLILNNTKIAAEVKCLNRRMDSRDQITEIVQEFERFLTFHLSNYYKEIPNHSITLRIEKFLGVSFIARQRPSFFIDSVHMFQKDEDEKSVVKKLMDVGIFSKVGVVEKQKQLVIPCVNSSDVTRIVTKLI